jgi:hypothetical protein
LFINRTPRHGIVARRDPLHQRISAVDNDARLSRLIFDTQRLEKEINSGREAYAVEKFLGLK